MPRAALLSIHARVADTEPGALDDPSLVQVWGPRYHVYVVAAHDLAVFTLGRLPEGGKTRRTAEALAPRLRGFDRNDRDQVGGGAAAHRVDGSAARHR